MSKKTRWCYGLGDISPASVLQEDSGDVCSPPETAASDSLF